MVDGIAYMNDVGDTRFLTFLEIDKFTKAAWRHWLSEEIRDGRSIKAMSGLGLGSRCGNERHCEIVPVVL
jgi:hypothetical protein